MISDCYDVLVIDGISYVGSYHVDYLYHLYNKDHERIFDEFKERFSNSLNDLLYHGIKNIIFTIIQEQILRDFDNK